MGIADAADAVVVSVLRFDPSKPLEFGVPLLREVAGERAVASERLGGVGG